MGEIPYQSPGLPQGSPLSPEQLAEVRAAEGRRRILRRATGVAYTDAWIGSVFAVMCLLSGVFGVVGFILGAALSLVAFNSFRGAKRLSRLDPTAPRLLAWNQIFLFVSILVYCLWNLWDARNGMGTMQAMIGTGGTGDAETDKTIKSIQDLGTTIIYTIYLAVIAGSLVGQGLAALYYATRAKHIREYLASTPQWILDVQATRPK